MKQSTLKFTENKTVTLDNTTDDSISNPQTREQKRKKIQKQTHEQTYEPPKKQIKTFQCRFNCGKVFSHSSSESRHARECKIIIYERRNSSQNQKLKKEIYTLKAQINRLEFLLKNKI